MKKQDNLQALKALLEELRDKHHGCSWTCAQDFQSLAPMTIEESYELQQAILSKDISAIRDELGDLLYHVVFYAHIAQEQSLFDLNDIAAVMLKKHEQRMPEKALRQTMTAEQINAHWSSLKTQTPKKAGFLEPLKNIFPAIKKAVKLQDKAAEVGFDWPTLEGVIDKFDEEVLECKEALKTPTNKAAIEDELGDVFFTLINLSRHLQVDSEQVIEKANQKFMHRFAHIEKSLNAQEKSLNDCTLKELERLWQEAKHSA